MYDDKLIIFRKGGMDSASHKKVERSRMAELAIFVIECMMKKSSYLKREE